MSNQQSGRDWVWYGGRPSVDFVNTLRDRFSGGRELLQEPGDLTAWLTTAERRGPADAGDPSVHFAVDAALLTQALELREAIDAGLRAVVDHQPFPPEAADVINGWLARAAGQPPVLDVREGGPSLRHGSRLAGADGALSRIALDAAEILGGETRRRLKICGGVRCSARFYDKSPACRRRWCSMAGCGNRAKAAQHRQRSDAPN
ncbi:CGNR zinc finger domain-containing protein [Actinomadura harenae]|uniref:Zinc finger CGNR domain-containing protein n=1 Tax=Actinomadura harenae TaxID=2483351 RepID=A0A3M2M5Z8_9ACTN|nr:ABATE domain-containing protein [Actinomadura harenae]RMI44932.1 hypothetical protein EBO15_11725 [Actinomadura harenae]